MVNLAEMNHVRKPPDGTRPSSAQPSHQLRMGYGLNLSSFQLPISLHRQHGELIIVG
jgi:hypothetical protein